MTSHAPNLSRGSADDTRRALIALNLVNGDRGLICALGQRLRSTRDFNDNGFAREAAAELETRPGRVRQLLSAAGAAQTDVDTQLAKARESNAAIVTLCDAAYPEPLRDLGLQAPPVLHVRGDLATTPGISIVGSRKADSYGLEVAEWFAGRLAAAGLVVISGFARGIDQAAHQGAIRARAGTGRTTAVLGCGLDIDYPRNSRRLAAAVARCGAVVSEFPFGFAPRSLNFPIRNRIIAALGYATIVVRAASRSGSLITARLALDLGREVLAVPGSVLSRASAGAHLLLRDGATPAIDPDLLLETLPTAILERLEQQGPTAEATGSTDDPADTDRPSDPGRKSASEPANLLGALHGGARNAEQLASQLNVPFPTVLATLVRLEVDGLVRRLPGGAYAIANR